MNGDLGTTELAEEIFEAMQQRTNHFSTYTPPTEVTYNRLIQVRISNDRKSDPLSHRSIAKQIILNSFLQYVINRHDHYRHI